MVAPETMLMAYEAVAQGPEGLRYGVRERDGVCIADRAEAATAFQSRAEAQEFAEELTELHDRIGLKFEAKEIERWTKKN